MTTLRRSIAVSVWILLALVPGRAGLLRAQEAPPPVGEASAEPPIRPGDMVKIQVWREPELTGQYLVDERGIVTLPKLGTIDVTRETQTTLRERVVEELSRSLVNPAIQLFVLRRVSILGEVHHPGLYNLDPTMSVGNAVAQAGGATPMGRTNEVVLMRDGREVEANLSVNQAVADSPIRSGDQLVVPERSWFARNTGALVTGISATVGILVALLR